MRAVGARLSSGRMVWADAGTHDPVPGERVRVLTGGIQEIAIVVVAADHFLRPPRRLHGEVLECVETRENVTAGTIPGSDLPPLGNRVKVPSGIGTVTALEPVERWVTVTLDDGACERLAAHDVHEVGIDGR